MSTIFEGLAPLPPGVRPATLPSNPIPAPRTALGRDALELYKAAELAAVRITECEERAVKAGHAYRDAKRALQAEVEKSGRAEYDPKRTEELVEAVKAAEIYAQPNLHVHAHRSAMKAHDAAVWEWKSFVGTHLGELIAAELAPEAERVSAKLTKALEALQPIEAEYSMIEYNVRNLVAVFNGAGSEKWQQLEARPLPPLPARELYARDADDSEPATEAADE